MQLTDGFKHRVDKVEETHYDLENRSEEIIQNVA